MMLTRIRLELTVLAALGVAIAALVLMMRDEAPRVPVVAGAPTGAQEDAVLGSAVPAGASEVEIINFVYLPEPVRVRAGAPVVWTNRDQAAHTVTARDRSWTSPIMSQGETFVTTFDEPGVYTYICELHPPALGTIPRVPGEKLVAGGSGGMKGTIIVE